MTEINIVPFPQRSTAASVRNVQLAATLVSFQLDSLYRALRDFDDLDPHAAYPALFQRKRRGLLRKMERDAADALAAGKGLEELDARILRPPEATSIYWRGFAMSAPRTLPPSMEKQRRWLEDQQARSSRIMDDPVFTRLQREQHRRRYDAASDQLLAFQEYIDGKRRFVIFDGLLR